MPPKTQDKPSKKATRERAKEAIDEQSFGLKNKNKSKKVQQFISRVEKGVKNNSGLTDAAKFKEAKKEAKIAKQLEEEQLRAILNEGISNQFGKKKTQAASAASKLGIAEASDEVNKILDQFSSDSEDEEEETNKRKRGPEMYIIEDEPVAVEIFREKTIEDIVEEQRQKLLAEGKKGTPVTAESFAKWRAAKLAKRQADAEARVKAEQSKKKGGKGLSVLSGKELFNYNASLFVDDDAALDAKEETELAEEGRLEEERAEAAAAEEAKAAQREQERLQEIQRLEMEELERRYELRRERARDPNRPTFLLGGVVINECVFIEDEPEDLSPFPDVIFQQVSEEPSSGDAAASADNGEPMQGQSFEIDMGGDEDENDVADEDQDQNGEDEEIDDDEDEDEGDDDEDLRPAEDA